MEGDENDEKEAQIADHSFIRMLFLFGWIVKPYKNATFFKGTFCILIIFELWL